MLDLINAIQPWVNGVVAFAAGLWVLTRPDRDPSWTVVGACLTVIAPGLVWMPADPWLSQIRTTVLRIVFLVLYIGVAFAVQRRHVEQRAARAAVEEAFLSDS